MTQSEIDAGIVELEEAIKVAKVDLERAQRLEQLMDNPLYQEFVMSGFQTQHALEQVAQKAMPHAMADRESKAIDAALMGVSAYHQYIQAIIRKGNDAADTIRRAEQDIEELSSIDLNAEY